MDFGYFNTNILHIVPSFRHDLNAQYLTIWRDYRDFRFIAILMFKKISCTLMELLQLLGLSNQEPDSENCFYSITVP